MMYVMARGQENRDQNLESSQRTFPTGFCGQRERESSGGHRPLKVVIVSECGPGPMVRSAPCTLCRKYCPLGAVKALWLRQHNTIQGCCAGEGSKAT